jgi:hypothetical protein
MASTDKPRGSSKGAPSSKTIIRSPEVGQLHAKLLSRCDILTLFLTNTNDDFQLHE